MFSSYMRVDEGGVLSEAGFSGWGGFSGWVGLWMEVVVRIGIWGIFGFRTIEWPWTSCGSFRLSCHLRHFPPVPY